MARRLECGQLIEPALMLERDAFTTGRRGSFRLHNDHFSTFKYESHPNEGLAQMVLSLSVTRADREKFTSQTSRTPYGAG